MLPEKMNSDNDFPKWNEERDAALIVCDENDIIVFMNLKRKRFKILGY
jgi:phenolic acid decarboxylase